MKLDKLSLTIFVKLRSLGYLDDTQVIVAIKSGKLKNQLTKLEFEEVREAFGF